MRSAVRLGAVVILLLGCSIVLPPSVGPVSSPKAAAQLPPIPIPDLPELPGLPDPIPDPQPEPEETPPPEDGSTEDPGADEEDLPDDSSSAQAPDPDPSGDVAGDGAQPGRSRRSIAPSEIPTFDYARIPGAYSTDGLLMAAARLRSLGWSGERVASEVFPPFIIAGRANWVDSWGAARYGPGPIVRRHEGQDVFCEYGDPVLAVQDGVVDYGDGGLGGIVARLHRPGGGYWYYAHLSETNAEEYPAGATVGRGQVIGFCGNSGNAITTPPHVHFGWYRSNGTAANPMFKLVSWLERAEAHAALTVAKASGRRVSRLSSLVSARRFGDGLIPGLEPAGLTRVQTVVALGKSVLTSALAADASSRDAQFAKESAD